MHHTIKTALAAASALAFAVPVAASTNAPQTEDIFVTPAKDKASNKMDSWRQSATRDLNRNLERAERFRSAGRAEGIVQMRFTLDKKGAPVNMYTQSNSAGSSAEKVAKRALRRMRSFDDAPVADAKGRTFQANIIFATSVRQKEQLAAKLGHMESSRLASSGGAGAVIVLGS